MNIDSFFTIETISLSATALFNLILLIIILSKKNNTRNSYYFAGFVFSLFFWITATLLHYTLPPGDGLILITRLVYFIPPFIPVFMILFTKTFPKLPLDYSKLKLSLFLFFPILTSVLVLIPDLIIKDVNIIDDYKVIIYGPLYFFYFLDIVIYFMMVFYLIIEKYFILQDRERGQVEMIFLSLIIGSVAGVTTSLIMPSFGNFSLFWVGSLYSGNMVLAIFYGIVKYGLFDIKLVSTEFITISSWFLIFIKIVLEKDSANRAIDFVLLVLIIISGIVVIRSIMKEIYLRERLEILNKKKTEFVSLATHQLRAPLTSMKGYTSMLLDGTFGEINNPEMFDAIDKISKSTSELTMIVEDYLDVARIEQGKMRYSNSVFDVVDVIKDAIYELKPLANKTSLIIDLYYDNTIEYGVNMDQGKIKQVFLNIIDNAIKYTPQGQINVYIDKIENNKVLVKVSDTGVGINKDILPTLFNKFVQAPGSSKINILGTGLGLYVAGEILKAHDAKAWAESDGEGKGSTFYVELGLI